MHIARDFPEQPLFSREKKQLLFFACYSFQEKKAGFSAFLVLLLFP